MFLVALFGPIIQQRPEIGVHLDRGLFFALLVQVLSILIARLVSPDGSVTNHYHYYHRGRRTKRPKHR